LVGFKIAKKKNKKTTKKKKKKKKNKTPARILPLFFFPPPPPPPPPILVTMCSAVGRACMHKCGQRETCASEQLCMDPATRHVFNRHLCSPSCSESQQMEPLCSLRDPPAGEGGALRTCRWLHTSIDNYLHAPRQRDHTGLVRYSAIDNWVSHCSRPPATQRNATPPPAFSHAHSYVPTYARTQRAPGCAGWDSRKRRDSRAPRYMLMEHN